MPKPTSPWSFVTTPRTPTPSARCPVMKLASSVLFTKHSKSCRDFKRSAPQCPILGLGLFRKIQFHPIPTPLHRPNHQRRGPPTPRQLSKSTPPPQMSIPSLPICPAQTKVNLCKGRKFHDHIRRDHH